MKVPYIEVSDYGLRDVYHFPNYRRKMIFPGPLQGAILAPHPSVFSEWGRTAKGNCVIHAKADSSLYIDTDGNEYYDGLNIAWRSGDSEQAHLTVVEPGFLADISVSIRRNHHYPASNITNFAISVNLYRHPIRDWGGWMYAPCVSLANYVSLTWNDSVYQNINSVSGYNTRAYEDLVKAYGMLYRDVWFNPTHDYWPAPEELMVLVKRIYNHSRSHFPKPERDTLIMTTRIYPDVSLCPADDVPYIFDEMSLIRQGVTLKPYATYHLKSLRQSAYLGMLDDVPIANNNNISNLIEIVSFLKALIIDHRIEIPDSWQSAWLSYRYAISTTKSDIEEAVNFFKRHVDTSFLRKGFKCYGITSRVLDVPVTCRCCADLQLKELNQLEDIILHLEQYGLTPNFYVFWDMVPYSFIVDWFIPVGDILKGYDTVQKYTREYSITDIWYSIKYTRPSDKLLWSVYSRWVEGNLPEFQGYYVFDDHYASTKTHVKRSVDVASLVTQVLKGD